MLNFDSDYTRGAHPEVMRRLTETNLEATVGYGLDPYCIKAASLIRKACGLPEEALVSFLIGGTQTNTTVIDALLRHCQGVVAAESAHINVHESGAIEATGHKVLALPTSDGKLTARQIDEYVGSFYADDTWEHMVQPGMVYITHPTELGTLYTLAELEAISEVCRRRGLPLYLDGARLAYALGSAGTDVRLPDIARLCDAFYIGGTKAGALMGEAVVCSDSRLLPRFFSLVKQHGALLAKGRLLGLQFEALFTDGLYERIGRNADRMAARLAEGFTSRGYRLLLPSPTNQQFPILPNALIAALRPEVGFEYWGAPGAEESAVRFVTDWSTTEADIDALMALVPPAAEYAEKSGVGC